MLSIEYIVQCLLWEQDRKHFLLDMLHVERKNQDRL